MLARAAPSPPLFSPALRRGPAQRRSLRMSAPVRASGDADADGGEARLLALGASKAEAAAMARFLTSAGSNHDEVATRMLRFCRVLGVSASNAFRFSSTQFALFSLDEQALGARMAALRAALPAGTNASEVVGQAPTLLFAEAEELAAARADLAFLPAALLAPLLEKEPTLLMQALRGPPRLAELRAAWQAGPFAALPADHQPADDDERASLRRYARDALASDYV